MLFTGMGNTVKGECRVCGIDYARREGLYVLCRGITIFGSQILFV